MNDTDIRAQLHRLIEDIDSGRVAVHRPRVRLGLTSTVLAASLGLGVAGCPSEHTGAHPEPAPTVIDPDVVAEYMAPDPDQRPVDPGPVALYAVPAPGPEPSTGPIDPAPQPEYMAPGPIQPTDPDDPGFAKPPPGTVQPIDPGPVAEYAAPDPGTIDPMPRPMYMAPAPVPHKD